MVIHEPCELLNMEGKPRLHLWNKAYRCDPVEHIQSHIYIGNKPFIASYESVWGWLFILIFYMRLINLRKIHMSCVAAESLLPAEHLLLVEL